MIGRRLLSALAAAALPLAALPLVATSAEAAPGDEARSGGQFLSGTLLPVDVDEQVVSLGGAEAQYVEQNPAQPADSQAVPLDVGALGAVRIQIPGGVVPVDLGTLLRLGAVNQYAEAGPSGVSRAASGAVSDAGAVDTSGAGEFPARARLDLMTLLAHVPGSDALLTDAGLTLGGVTGVAALDAGRLNDGTAVATSCAELSAPEHCRGYSIAEATLALESPAVGALASTVNTEVANLSAALDGLGDEIEAGLVDGLTAALGALNGVVPGLSIVDTDLRVDLTADLAPVVDGILGETRTADGVTLDLIDGTVTVDYTELLDINDLAPNTPLLSGPALTALTNALAVLLADVQGDINTALATVTDSVTATITNESGTGPASVCLLAVPLVGCTAGLELGFDGSLADLLDASEPLTVSGTGALALIPDGVLRTVVATIQTTTATVVDPLVTGLLSGTGTVLSTAVRTLSTALTGTLALVRQAADVTINRQVEDVDGAGTLTEVAVRVHVLPGVGGGATLDLGKAVVGPNAARVFTPSLTATSPVESGTETVVGGTGWPPDTAVSLQLLDSNSPVGDPVVVTADGNGGLPEPTTLPVPAGTAPGDYTVFATGIDGLTASADVTVVDTRPPAAPVITAPVDGTRTHDDEPVLAGTASPDATTVDVTIGGPGGPYVLPDVPVTEGSWTVDLTDAGVTLRDGEHTATATATDAAGNTSRPSAPVGFTVDATAPTAPRITAPADGSSTNAVSVPIQGTAPADAVAVDVVLTRPDGTTTPFDDVPVTAGTWTVTTGHLGEGAFSVVATALDEAGNRSAESDVVDFTVDRTGPPAPAITEPSESSTIGDNTPTITGTGEPGATVDLTVTDSAGATHSYEDIPVGRDGTWVLDVPDELADGSVRATARQTDPAGNTSATSASVTFTVDTDAPRAPVITEPSSGSTTADTSPTVAGTAPADAVTVDVTIHGPDGPHTVRHAPVRDGHWTVGAPELRDGTYTATAVATDGAGNSSATSSSVTFTVDTSAPDAPVVTEPADGSSTDDTEPPVAGTAPEDAVTVDITIDGPGGPHSIRSVPVTDGAWSVDLTDEGVTLSEGTHTVTATATDAAGNISGPSAPVDFAVDTTTPAAPVITRPTHGSTIGDTTPTVTGTGEPGATVEVTVDGEVVDTTTVAPDGIWSLEVREPLGIGAHTVTATQTDPSGHTSPDSDPVVFEVDDREDAPVITAPTSGSATNDATPRVAGTGIPGSTVTVTDQDGNVLGRTVVRRDGTWSLISTALEDGPHTITATQADAQDNVSPASRPVVFRVDTARPQAPTITDPDTGDHVADSTPQVTGTGEPGNTLTVILTDHNGNETRYDTVVGLDGTWRVTPTSPLPDGRTTITAIQTDPAGNVSPASDPVVVRIDTTPAPPLILNPSDGDTVDQNPTVEGTGAPGATVTVHVDGKPIDTATVDAGGLWSAPVGSSLPCGTATLTATQTVDGVAGRFSGALRTVLGKGTSPMSDPVTVTVSCPAATGPAGTGTDGVAPTGGEILPQTGAEISAGTAALGVLLGLLFVAGGALLIRRQRV